MSSLSPGLKLSAYLLGRRIAGQRKPATLWELLYEGQVTTSNAASDLNGYFVDIPFENAPIFQAGEGIKLTVNGISTVYTAETIGFIGATIGNPWLDGTTTTGIPDDGTDFCVSTVSFPEPIIRIGTRDPGTYVVKIEKALFAPVAYLFNGVRLPDIYKVYTSELQAQFLYAYIATSGMSTTYYHLLLSAAEEKARNISKIIGVSGAVFTLEDGAWVYKGKAKSGCGAIWANTDLYYEDSLTDVGGTLCLAASAPVPVYE